MVGRKDDPRTSDDEDAAAEDTDAPTWDNQLAHARRLSTDDLMRHASVSTSNRHRCEDCFCCAALTVLEQREGGVR